jgi:hypothetical protein
VVGTLPVSTSLHETNAHPVKSEKALYRVPHHPHDLGDGTLDGFEDLIERLLPRHVRVGFLLHAAALDLQKLGPRRNLSMPGVSVTVGEQIEAFRKVAGEAVTKRIKREPDETIMRS